MKFSPLMCWLWIGLVLSPISAAEPVKLIFDTDMGNDCDDVLALGMIHALQSRGECELLAVTITKDHPLAAPFVDVVNTFYGRGDIPIGVCRSGVTDHAGKFNLLAEVRADNSRNSSSDYRYPHDLVSGTVAPDAVDVLRRTLTASDDGSVVIIQVGFSTNLANLLQSQPDQHSDATGLELVRAKVRLLSLMAGAFTQIVGDQGHRYDHKEYNVVQDVSSAQRLVTQWPTPMIWSGFEIGIALPYPSDSIESDYRYVEHHPLPEAYTLYNPPPHNRPTWDLTSVLQAVRPNRSYFTLSPLGDVRVADNGLTTFEPNDGGLSRYLKLEQTQKPRTTEAMVQLSSQLPSVVQRRLGPLNR